MKTLLVIVACAGAFSGATSAGTPATGPSREDIAENAVRSLEAALSAEQFRGAFLVALGDQLLLARGFGTADRSETTPATLDTPYWTASIAKNFTAAGILRLQVEGKLNVEDLVSDHLDVPAAWKTMTLHHLLSHTSGLRQAYVADDYAIRDDALAALLDSPLRHPPGEGWSYSNDAYSLLAILIERISGQRYEDYLRAAVFTRAGLTDTGFRADPPPGLAELADPSYETMEVTWGYRGGHGLATSARDLYRWWNALQADAVLPAELRRAMLGPQAEIRDGLSTGYGWFQSRTPAGRVAVWTRGTDQSGENGILYAVPELDLVVVGVSHHQGDTDPITRRMADRFVAEFEAELAAAEIRTGP